MCKRFCLICLLVCLSFSSVWSADSSSPEPSTAPSFETLRLLLTSIESEAIALTEESALLSDNLKQASDALKVLQTEQQKLRSLYERQSKSLRHWTTAAVVLGLLSVGLIVVR